MTDEEEKEKQEYEDFLLRPRRFWTYAKDKWDPEWWHKIGLPYFGGDEWGRRTIVIGLAGIGYVCMALWTCWCQECHFGRSQTYQDADPVISRHMLTLWGVLPSDDNGTS